MNRIGAPVVSSRGWAHGAGPRGCCTAVLAASAHTLQASSAQWPGLPAWRAAAIDRRFGWGDKGPSEGGDPRAPPPPPLPPLGATLVECGAQVLRTPDPALKCAITHAAWAAHREGGLPLGAGAASARVRPPARPARPQRPRSVVPRDVPSPKDSPLPLAAHLLHGLAHIELNAVDLAWDTVVRFAPLGLSDAFYTDFARVADDEARHFGWCEQRLAELRAAYGDMVAHDLLWQGCEASAGDLSARLAVVPMSQEARGLDAGQRLVHRLMSSGDRRSAAIVERIAREERAHVAVGVFWFQRVCASMGADPAASFRGWLKLLGPDLLKGPFNHPAREEVGLPRSYYDTTHWPAHELSGMEAPATAAAARGRGEPPASAATAAAAGAATPTTLPVGDAEQLERLRRRLHALSEAELAAAGGGCGG